MSSDLAVLGREDACAPVGEETAQRRTADRSRDVHGREALLFEGPLEVLHDDARFGGDGQCRLVDLDDAIQAAWCRAGCRRTWAAPRPASQSPPPQVVSGIL